MAWLWFLAVVVAAALVLGLIRRRFGPARVHRRIASPLAVVERALHDALLELSAERPAALDIAGPLPAERPTGAPGLSGFQEVWVNPFEPCAERLLTISEAELWSLGREVSLEHHRLVSVIRAWNAAAGRVERPASLLPLLLAAHQAAHALSLHLEEEAVSRARSDASARVLQSLVGARGVELWTN